MNNRFKMGELFCGPGGMALGAQMANHAIGGKGEIAHVWATDYDKDSCETYSNNIGTAVVHADIRQMNFARLKKESEIDALSFGFPCNDFSVVGEQKGMNGTYGPLYEYGVKALRYFRPQWFVAENVGGLRNANDGQTFETMLAELVHAGYRVHAHLYAFDRYGVPQARRRIIIVGIRDDLRVTYCVPSPAPYRHLNVSCRYALEHPPIANDAPNNELTKQSPQVVKRLRYIKPGQNAFTADLPKPLQLNVKGAKISQIYRRLEPHKPAYTVTGSGGGGTHVYHWHEARALTNRERARLQTFPDEYIFSGSKESVRKQIGMAVPCTGMRVVFESILKSFAGVSYPSIAANIHVPKRNRNGACTR